MSIPKECLCCKEIAQVVEKMDGYEAEQLDCITDHPRFKAVCLDVWVLETAYFQCRCGRRFVPRNESTGSTRSQIRSKAAVLTRHWPNVSAYIIAYIFITCVE